MFFSFQDDTRNDTGTPPLETRLTIEGLLILLTGVIIASMDQIRSHINKPNTQDGNLAILLFMLINTVTIVHSVPHMFQFDGNKGIMGKPRQNLTMIITGNHSMVKANKSHLIFATPGDKISIECNVTNYSKGNTFESKGQIKLNQKQSKLFLTPQLYN